MLTLVVTLTTGDIFAQTRKKSTSKKSTTTAVKRNSGSAGSAAKPITQADIEGNYYTGQWIMEGFEKIGKNVGMDMTIKFKTDEATVYTCDTDLPCTWSITGNTINCKLPNGSIKLTSPDKGKTLKGTLFSQKGNAPLIFRQMPNGHLDNEALKKAFNNGLFKCDVYVAQHTGGISFPAEFKTTPNADGTGGSYKVATDNAIGIGIIKGTYKFTEDGVVFTSNLSNCSSKTQKPLDSYKAMYAQIGSTTMDNGTHPAVTLVLFLK